MLESDADASDGEVPLSPAANTTTQPEPRHGNRPGNGRDPTQARKGAKKRERSTRGSDASSGERTRSKGMQDVAAPGVAGRNRFDAIGESDDETAALELQSQGPMGDSLELCVQNS
jgi:hypothetical protein